MPSPSNRILDDPDLNNSLNTIFSISNQLSHAVYLLILGLLSIVCVGMAIVQIPVYIHSRGIMRPSSEVNQILAPVPGIIHEIEVFENQSVSKGQTILKLETAKEEQHKNLLINELDLIQLWIDDLNELINTNNTSANLHSEKYRVEIKLYNEEIRSIDLKMNLAETEYKKYKNLYEEKYVSEKEYDEVVLKYKSLKSEKNKLISGKQMQITNELSECLLRKSDLVRQITEVSYFLEKATIEAPVSGIIQGIRNNYPGEYCSAGINICRLIPDTGLIAELYIPPKDIGFIRPGQEVRLLIDSYDYKYWGAMTVKCTSVSDDIEIIDNKALFRVICEIQSQNWLEYQNTRVKPGKGMTLTAQFLIMKKNLWQLLRDQAYNLALHDPGLKKEWK